MKFLSVCSGIEAASVAWSPLGWKASGFSEIEPFPSAVLAHHYPDVPNHGDMTALPSKIVDGQVEAADLLCGGTPCQAFSVAGKRQSLDDARGNLTLTFCEIADAIDTVRTQRGKQPCIVFWENVPGVLSTKDNAFGCFLGELAGESCELKPAGAKWSNAGCVFGPKRAVAWRVLDAQYFGVAQRRRRVFVVASARADFDPAAVLFEFEGVRRDTAPSREAGERIATCLASSPASSSSPNVGNGQGTVVEVCGTLTARGPDSYGFPEIDGGQILPVSSGVDPHTVATLCATDAAKWGSNQWVKEGKAILQPIALDYEYNSHSIDEPTGPLLKGSPSGGGHPLPAVMSPAAVRRLTPVECERLQGFPDDYTNIPWRKQPVSPDGPRYKALGNSWAVPVVHWIGARIQNHLFADLL